MRWFGKGFERTILSDKREQDGDTNTSVALEATRGILGFWDRVRGVLGSRACCHQATGT